MLKEASSTCQSQKIWLLFLRLQSTASRDNITPFNLLSGFPHLPKTGTKGFLQFIFKYFYYSEHFLLFTLRKTTLQVLSSSSIITLHHPSCQLFPLMCPWDKFNFGNSSECGSWPPLLWIPLLSIYFSISWLPSFSPSWQVGNHSFSKHLQWAWMPFWPGSSERSINSNNFNLSSTPIRPVPIAPYIDLIAAGFVIPAKNFLSRELKMMYLSTSLTNVLIWKNLSWSNIYTYTL